MSRRAASAGKYPHRHWYCTSCPDSSGRGSAQPTRESAAAHAEATGHPVYWVSGFSELLITLLDTQPPAPGGTVCRNTWPSPPAMVTDVATGELVPAGPDARVATCGTCGRSWDDAIITGVTPVPAGRCPFEYLHETGEG